MPNEIKTDLRATCCSYSAQKGAIMKKLTLQTLTLVNFKGQNFTLETHGKNVSVWGENATGKTTLYDAVCWLLFGKDSSFKTDFEIKNLNADGTAQHNLCHEVKGLFRWDGKVIELRKVYAEIWTKKRGQHTKEFTGHSTDHFIDGVSRSKGEYQKFIAEIATEETFKLLTSPFYFSEKMKWTDRRALLMSLVGDITDGDVIKSNPDLKELTKVLDGRLLDDHKKVIAAKRKTINEQLEKIPVRIDEVVKGMPEISGIIVIEEKDNVADATKAIEDIEAKLSNLKNTGALAELQQDLARAETALITATNAVTQKHNADIQVVREKINALKNTIGNKEAMVINQRAALEREEEAKKFLLENRERLVQEWKDLKATDLLFKESMARAHCTCSICGDVHDLPAEKIKAIAAQHNIEQSQALASNQKSGILKKQSILDADAKIKSIAESIASLEKEIPPLKAEHERLFTSINDPEGFVLQMMIDADPAIKEAIDNKTLLVARIEREKAGEIDDTAIFDLEFEMALKMNGRRKAETRLAIVDAAAKAQARKTELEAEQKTAAAELERLESELALIEDFTRAKVGLLEGKINGMFSMARFRMFETAINGGLQECCKVTFNGVPFESSLNQSARINVGLDIISTISKNMGLSVPVFCDNAESVVSINKIDTQMIRLVVSSGRWVGGPSPDDPEAQAVFIPDDVLRVEIDQ